MLHGISGTALSHATHVLVAGSVAALAGAGSASAATLAPSAGKPPAITASSDHHDSPGRHTAWGRHGAGRWAHGRRANGRWANGRRAHGRQNPASLAAARHAAHGVVPNADRLMPVGTTGPQSFTPISPAQRANAATIVKRTLANKMGIRSAVIAVATALQESKLLNLNYGTSASLGLFQQQWDMGWGTPQQIMNPAYASDAFLKALQTYQASDPAWASQPLYQAAQGVQKSAYPYAYAQWEAQAAQLTGQIATHLTR